MERYYRDQANRDVEVHSYQTGRRQRVRGHTLHGWEDHLLGQRVEEA